MGLSCKRDGKRKGADKRERERSVKIKKIFVALKQLVVDLSPPPFIFCKFCPVVVCSDGGGGGCGGR